MSEPKTEWAGVLVGLVNMGDGGYRIGVGTPAGLVTIKPEQAASLADQLMTLLEGLGYGGGDEIDDDEDSCGGAVH
jgi:hypothetical protein